MSIDVIDHLAGLAPDGPLAAIRNVRRQAREQAQASYAALFETSELAHMSRDERHAVATFVAALHRDTTTSAFYAKSLPDDLAITIATEATRGMASGPFGAYPAGPLSVEDTTGPVYTASPGVAPRLAAALNHAHMLVFHLRDSSPAHLQALLDAGWSTTGIVTLSQLVAFLSFQIRVVHGLRTLAGKGVN